MQVLKGSSTADLILLPLDVARIFSGNLNLAYHGVGQFGSKFRVKCFT